jgi:hypothetical protein
MLSLFCGNRYPPLLSGSPLPLAQFAEPFLIKRFRGSDNRSDSEPIFYRHRVGTIIDIPSESLSASDRNPYRHRSESTLSNVEKQNTAMGVPTGGRGNQTGRAKAA